MGAIYSVAEAYALSIADTTRVETVDEGHQAFLPSVKNSPANGGDAYTMLSVFRVAAVEYIPVDRPMRVNVYIRYKNAAGVTCVSTPGEVNDVALQTLLKACRTAVVNPATPKAGDVVDVTTVTLP